MPSYTPTDDFLRLETSTAGERDKHAISFVSFQWWVRELRDRELCLLLGFPHGFQLWNVHDVGNIYQMLFVPHDGIIKDMKLIPPPHRSSRYADRFQNLRPLIALMYDSFFHFSSYLLLGDAYRTTVPSGTTLE